MVARNNKFVFMRKIVEEGNELADVVQVTPGRKISSMNEDIAKGNLVCHLGGQIENSSTPLLEVFLWELVHLLYFPQEQLH